jgi:hypothetical protein
MELLPALVVGTFLSLHFFSGEIERRRPLVARLMYPIALSLAAINCVAMMYQVPLVLKEAMANSKTRIPFEAALARTLDSFQPGAPIMMYTSDHIGAVQQAGIPLRQMVSELDADSWKVALASPADHAAYVVAMAGDPLSKAVQEHPEGLTELTILCTTGQPCAHVYQSDRFKPLSH